MNGKKIIEAKGLKAGFKDHVLWSDADFSLSPGEFAVVLGPNGAGKTTLFRLLLGLDDPQDGELKLFGKKPERGNARIGYVPQRHRVDAEDTIEVLEVVRLGICERQWGFDSPGEAKIEREEAMRALESVDADHLAHQSLGTLSGGEQQRIFLAQALVGKPELLLLDEPLANMDIRREAELVRLIKTIVEETNVGVLLIAHNVNPLLGVIDKIIYIANKRVATGTPEEALTSESLSRLYGTQIEVLHDSKGRLAIIDSGEAPHHEDLR